MRWLRKLFRRLSPPPAGRSPGDDWRPGDLAECVVADPWYRGDGALQPEGPRLGEIRMVTGVSGSRHFPERVFLHFARYGRRKYDAAAFRKIVPRADARVAAEGGTLPVPTSPSPPVPVPLHEMGVL